MAGKVHRMREARGLAATALRAGAVSEGLTGVRWNLAGPCLNPRVVEYVGRPDAKERRAGVPSMTVTMDTRCRRCMPCLRLRAGLWRHRAKSEWMGAYRTWFGTLTLSPDRQALAAYAARRELLRRGVDPSSLSAEEAFLARHDMIAKEITKWLKRIRKSSGAKLRYLLVAEAHKSGDPHYHVLIHEIKEDSEVSERCLRTQWTWGFSKFNLVRDAKAAAYVTKYLSKSVLARVRASLRYGNHDLTSQHVAKPVRDDLPHPNQFPQKGRKT